MKAIFQREFKSYYSGPLGYIVSLVYFIYYAIMFVGCYKNGSPLVANILSSSYMVTLFTVPILTMRLFSEERKQKTDQTLFTAPVSITGVVLGKYFAALSVFGIPTLFTLVYQFIFSNYANVNWSEYLCALLGTILFAACLIAIGIFISTLTENQLVAALGTLAVSLVLMMLDSFASMLNNSVLTAAAAWISFIGRYQSFAEGLFDWSNFMFFLSLSALFTFLSVRIEESRRWA